MGSASAGTARGAVGTSWLVDETCLKVHGRWCYIYRAIDQDGNLIDAMPRPHRDKGGKGLLPFGQGSHGIRA